MAYAGGVKELNPLKKCRTCLTPVVDTKLFHPLTDRPQSEELTLAEILYEVTKLTPTTALPMFICSACCKCLVNALDFVRKAQRSNDSLLASLEVGKIGSDVDCLVEIPIEWPETKHDESIISATAELLEIKLEVKDKSLDSDGNIEDDVSWHDDESVKSTTTGNIPSEPVQHDKKIKYRDHLIRNSKDQYVCKLCKKAYLCIRSFRRHVVIHFDSSTFECKLCERTFRRRDKWQRHQRSKRHEKRLLESRSESQTKSIIEFPEMSGLTSLKKEPNLDGEQDQTSHLNNANNTKTNEIVPSNKARRRTRTRKSDINVEKNANGRFVCTVCHHTFAWHKDLERHSKIHTSEPQFSCSECDRSFLRKDKYHDHLRTHHSQQHNRSSNLSVEAPAKVPRSIKKGRQLDIGVCQPHGFKIIKCMICLSQHTTISDLRVHLQGHSKDVTLMERQQQQDAASIEDLSALFYPEEQSIKPDELKQRIMADVSSGLMDRFYSITNEIGNEIHLDSSETEYSDTEEAPENDPLSAENMTGKSTKGYNCEVCDSNVSVFRRKYELLHHQLLNHSPDTAPHVCVNCGTRFVSLFMLNHHTSRLCHNSKRRHICRKCPQRFMWRENLTTHMNIAHPAAADIAGSNGELRNYHCADCDRSFNMQKDLTRHRLTSHGATPAFQCLWCPRRFYRNSNYQTHLQRHSIPADQVQAAQSHVRVTSGPNGLKLIQCKVCNEVQCSVAELRRHLNLQAALTPEGHGIRPIEAPQNYSIMNQFGTELSLDDSETEADGDDNEDCQENGANTLRTYTCLLCSLRFQRKFQVLLHQRAMHKHEELPFRCSENCYFRTVCEDLLHHHQRNQCDNREKQHICHQCGTKFMWPENLMKHEQLLHSVEYDGVIKKEGAPCAGTETQVLNESVQQYQKSAIQPKKTKTKTLKKKVQVNKRKYLCSLCGCEMNSSSNLAVHMRRHTGEKPYKCDICDKNYARSSDMLTHRRTHTGERPHKCTLCEKAFARSSKLLMHMRTHSGERPYKCTYCEKCFSQSNDLRLHTRRHTGERPYGCDVCGERFIQNTALKQHRLLKGHQSLETPP